MDKVAVKTNVPYRSILGHPVITNRTPHSVSGYIYQEEIWHCRQCNGRIDREDKFCKHCGEKVNWDEV